mgnify:CR=1 FL=1
MYSMSRMISFDEIVAATRKLLDDPAQCKNAGRNGKELVTGIFDWKKMAEILSADYRLLWEKSNGR